MNSPVNIRDDSHGLDTEGTSIWLEVEPSLIGVRFLGVATRGVCAQVLGDEQAAEMDLALVEAATNVIKHGFANGCGGRLRVQINMSDHHVEVILRDDGPAFNPLTAPESAPWDNGDYESFESLPEGGFGIALIRALVDKCTYHRESDENFLTFQKIRK